jgi:acetolactate synthase-1/2/3 large subunit
MSSEGYSHGFLRPETAVGAEDARRTADVLVDMLVSAGVEVVFGIPGGAIAPIHDALLDRPEIRVITTRHESGAMFAAQAYARMTGKIGVVLVTSGPGILNAMTGLASAHCDGMPLLLIAGEVPRQVFGRQALQEGTTHHLDVIAACRAITKSATQVPSSDVAPAMLQRAISTALSGRRGPVVLTIPLDVLSVPIRAPRLVSDVFVAHRLESAAVSAAVNDVTRTLATAKRPLIFVGSGARWGAGPARVRELAERLRAPVMTTPKAKGVFPESHPLSLGVFGYGGHPSAVSYLEDGIDALLVIGSGLGDVATNGWSPLLTQARHFIQIDIDAAQIGRSYPATQGIVGDAASVLDAMLERLPARPRALRDFGVRRFTDAEREEHGPDGQITPMRALWELQQTVPRDTVFTCDIGEHLLFALHYLSIDDPDGFIVMTGLGSMGSSIASGLGSRLAYPHRGVVAVCGDGCFSMNLGDLAVAVRDDIPVVVAVLNDERYGMVELGHEAIFGRHPKFPSGPMDVVAMARSVGAEAFTIERSREITKLGLAQVMHKRPVVLDIRIDRRVKMPKNGRFEKLKASVTKTALN